MINHKHQMGTHSRDWGRSLGLDGYALAPAARDQAQARRGFSWFLPAPSQMVTNCRGRGLGSFIQMRPGPLSVRRWRFPTHARSSRWDGDRLTFMRAVSRPLSRIRQHVSCQGSNAAKCHSVTLFYVAGCDDQKHSERQISRVQEPFAFGARNECRVSHQ